MNQQRAASMQKLWLFVIACILFGAVTAHAAPAASVIVGVNVMGVDQISDAQQEALAQQLQDNGVKTIRTALGGHGDRYTSFVIKAHQHGIGSVILVSPFADNTKKHALPADASAGHPWGLPALQDADPDGFSRWFAAELAKLEAAGVRLVAFEAGNEINSSPFNADIAGPGVGRVLALADLNNPNDEQGRAVAAGYRAYLKILATLKNLRDHSELNKTTPIISGVSAWWGAPDQPKYAAMTGASMNGSIEFLRQNGLDKLVDGYAVHLYSSSDPHRSHAQRVAFLGAGFTECRHDTKPCWVTEWAYNNANRSCPIDDSLRLRLVHDERVAYKEFADQGRLAALMYYSWSGEYIGQKESPGTLFRCGALTDAGKLALSPF
jgi:hypothetical protein